MPWTTPAPSGGYLDSGEILLPVQTASTYRLGRYDKQFGVDCCVVPSQKWLLTCSTFPNRPRHTIPGNVS